MTLARRAQALVVAAALVGGGSLLAAGCSNAGVSLAEQACVHVDASIRLFDEAERAADAKTARAEATAATGQLEKALPLAARANSSDPVYNPLMTTLQEIGRTSEANLVPALRAQCAAVASPTGQGAVSGPGGATGQQG